LPEPLVERGDLIERCEHLGLEGSFHRRKRQIALVVEILVAGQGAFAALSTFGGLPAATFLIVGGGLRGGGRLGGRSRRRRGCGCRGGGAWNRCYATGRWRRHARNRSGHALAERTLGTGNAAIHRFEIDDVAQERLAFHQLVAPHGQRFEGEGPFAQGADHQLAACLDAFGDGDFAFARQELDRAHLAQIHAHGIIGAVVGLLRLLGNFGDGAAGGHGGHLLAVGLFLLLALDDVDAHLAEHRHGVFDLFRGHLVGGKHAVQLVIGDVAALLGARDHLAHRGIGHIQKRSIRIVFGGRARRGAFLGLRAAVLFQERFGIDFGCGRLRASTR
jgi:hypothetical protein